MGCGASKPSTKHFPVSKNQLKDILPQERALLNSHLRLYFPKK